MGILLKRYHKFERINPDDIPDDFDDTEYLKSQRNAEYGLLRIYKQAVRGCLSYEYPGGLSQMKKDVIERYGEKRVKEYLEGYM